MSGAHVPKYTHSGKLSGLRPHPGFIGPIWPWSMTAQELADNRAIMLASVERERQQGPSRSAQWRAWQEEGRAKVERAKRYEGLGFAVWLAALVAALVAFAASPAWGPASIAALLVAYALLWPRAFSP